MDKPPTATVTLLNPDVQAGTTQHSVCGRSGKIYGRSRYSKELGGHIFEVPADTFYAERNKMALDIGRNQMPNQCWIVAHVSIARPLAETPTQIPPPEQPNTTIDAMVELLRPYYRPEENQTPIDAVKALIATVQSRIAASEGEEETAETGIDEEFLDALLPYYLEGDTTPLVTLKRILATLEGPAPAAAAEETSDTPEAAAAREKARAELMGVPLPQLKEQAIALGFDIKGLTGKGDIIALMVPEPKQE